MLSCDRMESAKFIHGTPSPVKLVYYISITYLKIPVEEKCAELLTINTHRGLCKINRFHYGIKVDPTIFRKNNGYDVSRSGLRNS